MKERFLLLISFFAILLVGCKKESDEPSLTWVQIISSYETDGKGPEGEICVYDISRNHISDYTPYRILGTDWEPIHYILDVNGDRVRPIYSCELDADKDVNTGLYINKSTQSIYSNNLNNASKYLIVIEIPYNNCYTYTVIDWPKTNGTKLTKSFPRQINQNRQYIAW